MENIISKISDKEKILQKIKRIAFEIAEDNYNEKEIVLAGICKNTEGYAFATKLYDELVKICTSKITLSYIELDKTNPALREVTLQMTEAEIDQNVIILVDDVSNTGRTLMYAIKPFLNFSPKKIRCAVLVERKHRLFPVSPDYTGISLSTTLHETIKVVLSKEGEEGIYIM